MVDSSAVSARHVFESITPKALELIILPTEKCNFRCTYCYEDYAHGKMPESVQLGIENLIRNRAIDLKSLHLSWFGGEPLLGLDVMLRISRFARTLRDHHGFNLSGSTTTNAYLLTPKVLKALGECNQTFFQITLDGWGAVHDETRRRADGRGTFERIWTNLLAIKALPIEYRCCLRVHLRPDNIESVEHLCSQIRQMLSANDTRFYVDFQHIRDMGGDGGKTVQAWDMAEYHQIEGRLRALLQIPQSVGNSSQSDRGASQQAQQDGGVDICYASRTNSLLIRSNGRIGKCTVALTDERNTIGQLNQDGTLTIDPDRLSPWIRGLESLDLETLRCPAKLMPPMSTPVTFFRRDSPQSEATRRSHDVLSVA